jgi:hypothetical protein
MTERKCGQIMHLGPYSTEHKTINKLLAFIDANGIIVKGLHHEIYLSDPIIKKPDKMKKSIRYPVILENLQRLWFPNLLWNLRYFQQYCNDLSPPKFVIS